MSRLGQRLLAVSLVGLVGMALLATGSGFVGVVAAANTAPDCSTVTYNDADNDGKLDVDSVDRLQCIENNDLGGDYELTSDIDASETSDWNSGKGFEPIGSDTNRFAGSFDGRGHTISGLTVDRGDTYNVGLFANVDSGGTITDLALDGASITGYDLVGGVMGESDGTLSESYVSGDITGTSDTAQAGGLVGKNKINSGTVSNSYTTASVTGTGSDTDIGGIVGLNRGTIEYSYATGDVTGGSGNIGGLAGGNYYGTVQYSYWDKGTTNQGSAIGYHFDDTTTGLSGFGSTGDTSPAPEMQGSSGTTNMGDLDFSNTWETVEAGGDATADGYPILRGLDRQAQLESQGIYNQLQSVDSVTRVDATPTSANSVQYDVTFSSSASNVDTGDFTVTQVSPDASGNVASVDSSSGSTITVTVGSISGDGEIRLDVDSSVTYTSGEIYSIDNTEPTVSGVEILDNTDGNGVVSDGDTVQVTAEVTDANSISSVEADASTFDAGTVSLKDDGPNSNQGDNKYSATFTVGSSPTEGTQSVTVDATDEAGNGGSQGVTSGTLSVDTTEPSISNVGITDDADANGIVSDDETVQVTATVTDANVITSVEADASAFDGDTVTLKDDGPNSASGDNKYSATFTVGSAPTEGAQSVTVDATDEAGNGGNQGSPSGTLSVDTTEPSISNVGITDGTDGNGVVSGDETVQVTATVTDAHAITSVEADASTFDADTVTLADDGPNSNSGDDQYSATFTVGSSPTDGTQSVTVDATDEAGNGGSQSVASGDLIVDTTDPVFSSSTSASIDEGTTGDVLDVEAGDDGTNNPDTNVDYSLGSASGSDAEDFSIDSSTGQITLDSKKDFETPDDSDANNDYELTVTATDDGGNTNQQSVTVSVNDVNDAPTLSVSTTDTTFTEDGSAVSVFSSANADVVESSQQVKSLTVEVSNVADGSAETLTIDGSSVALTDGNSLTTANNGLTVTVAVSSGTATVTVSGGFSETTANTIVDNLEYEHTGDDPSTANDRTITLTEIVDDGGTANGGEDTTTLSASGTVSITARNDAPTMSTDTRSLTAIDEDDTTNDGTTVSSILASAGTTDDAEGDTLGVAITAVDDTDGTWEFSTDGGASWQTVNSASPATDNALLLAEDDRLRLVPNDNFAGSVSGSVTIRAWDQTSGSPGTYEDTSSSGGTTAFSTNTAKATVTVRDGPGVDSVTRAATNLTNANTVDFDVTFSESVSGVDADDFTLTTTDTATTANGDGDISVSGSGSSYTVSVANVQGNGDLGVDVIDDDSITSDVTSVPLGGVGTSGGAGDGSFTSGETYTIDNTVPSVSMESVVAKTGGNGAVSDGSTVQITATVTDVSAISTVEADASAFDAGTVTLADDGPNSTTGDDQYSATFTVGANPSAGDQSVTVNATDAAGNGGNQNTASGTLTVDLTAPTVSSFAVSNPSSQEIRVSLAANEELESIATSVSGAESATVAKDDFTESGSGPYTYTATYSGSSDGDYTVTLDTAEDAAGNDGASDESDTVAIKTSSSSSTNSGSAPDPEPDEPTDPQNETSDHPEPSVWDNETTIRQQVTVPTNAAVTRAEQVSLPASENTSGPAVVNFTKNALVSSMQFPAGTDGTVTVAEFDQNRSVYDDTPGRSVRQFQITGSPAVENATATIRTRIAESELQTGAINQSDVRLAHRTNGSWKILNTTVVEETNGTLVLEAPTEGLSPFAVTAAGTPEAALSVEPTAVSIGDKLTLDAGNSTTPYGEIVSYDWSVGGETQTGETATLTPEATGEHTVELTVTNDAGRTATATTSAVVENETGSEPTPDEPPDNSTQTDPSTPPTDDTANESETTTGDSGPGFGLIVALVALAGVALLAIRRSQ